MESFNNIGYLSVLWMMKLCIFCASKLVSQDGIAIFHHFSATLLPSIKRFLPKQWNEDLIVWRFPYFTSLEIKFTKSQGIETLPLGSFKTGAILLVGLFFYDIFWVFFTPVMGSVAKSLDPPIKLLFPTSNSASSFSMLGLGDIVTPGRLVVLA
ncbi:unnamed protein product [Trifolium pratense]|uniref:Uncharacterized protein n=1 Tax=Trifolium pratense TaxID=57577 RepID=A0ACB0M1K6_TRIPR|nr:unnamed protein product [Trifolium pratense]